MSRDIYSDSGELRREWDDKTGADVEAAQNKQRDAVRGNVVNGGGMVGQEAGFHEEADGRLPAAAEANHRVPFDAGERF